MVIFIGMEKYYFLFGLAFVWLIFAVAYDLKKKEVPNWLNFSLIGFALAYRAFYSAYSSDLMFFIFGLAGFGVFMALGNLFYYSRLFAGGDAKLLMGLGAVLPFEGWRDFIFVGAGFVALLFLAGAIYSLIYSFFIAGKDYAKFRRELANNWQKNKFIVIYSGILALALLIFAYLLGLGFGLGLMVALMMFSISILYIYLKAVDSCMIKLVDAGRLTEGDWLVSDIKLGRALIKKTVHGLSLEDIRRLRKAGKKVLIKEGIPFTPAILISFLVMVFFLAVLGFDFERMIFLLLS